MVDGFSTSSASTGNPVANLTVPSTVNADSYDRPGNGKALSETSMAKGARTSLLTLRIFLTENRNREVSLGMRKLRSCVSIKCIGSWRGSVSIPCKSAPRVETIVVHVYLFVYTGLVTNYAENTYKRRATLRRGMGLRKQSYL